METLTFSWVPGPRYSLVPRTLSKTAPSSTVESCSVTKPPLCSVTLSTVTVSETSS
jgi:hypothetical protein